MERDQVFISYSRKDREWLERLQTMLVPLTRAGFKIWADTLIITIFSVNWYKALKTGLGAERLPLETAVRLGAAVALMSVVALRLLDLREQLRGAPDQPAETAGLEAPDVAV